MKEPFSHTLRGDLFGNLAPYRNGKPHRGMDWHPAEGTIIPAIGAGLVVEIFWSDVLGWVVEQRIGEYYVQYCHLLSKPKSLQNRMPLKEGQPIGRVGNTGTATTGPHLHLAAAKEKHPHLLPYSKLIDPLTLFA